MTEKINALVESSFFRAIIKDSKDLYSLITTLFIFFVSSYYIVKKIDSDKLMSLDLHLIRLDNIPEPLYMFVTSIFLSIIVNFTRNILTIILDWIKLKTGVHTNND